MSAAASLGSIARSRSHGADGEQQHHRGHALSRMSTNAARRASALAGAAARRTVTQLPTLAPMTSAAAPPSDRSPAAASAMAMPTVAVADCSTAVASAAATRRRAAPSSRRPRDGAPTAAAPAGPAPATPATAIRWRRTACRRPSSARRRSAPFRGRRADACWRRRRASRAPADPGCNASSQRGHRRAEVGAHQIRSRPAPGSSGRR